MSNDPIITTCDHCDEVRECVLAADPFIEEVHADDDDDDCDHRETYWCEECYNSRHEEV